MRYEDSSSLLFYIILFLITFISAKELLAQERSIFWINQNKIYRGNSTGESYEEIVNTQWPSKFDIAEGHIFWIDRVNSTIKKSTLDGSVVLEVLDTLSLPDFVDLFKIDPKNKKIYLGYNSNIFQTNYDGSDSIEIFTGLRRAKSLEIDTLSEKIYWINDDSVIHRADLDGSNIEFLLTGLNRPWDIKLDINRGTIFWTEPDEELILKADLDSIIIDTIKTDVRTYSMTLDPISEKIYYEQSDKIFVMNYDGTGTELVNQLQIFCGIIYKMQFVNDKIYWTDDWCNYFMSVNNDGTNLKFVIIGIEELNGITIDSEGESIYFTDRTSIFRSNLDGSNTELIKRDGVPFGSLSDIRLDIPNEMMYWGVIDIEGLGAIRRAKLDGSNREILAYIYENNPKAITIDSINNKLYYSGGSKRIYRSNLDGSDFEVLMDDASQPFEIALDLNSNKMYWTETTGKIRRANLDGTSAEDILTGLTNPQGLVIDMNGRKIYWSESGKIRNSSLDGTNIQDIFSDIPGAQRIALTFESDLITAIEKTNGNNKLKSPYLSNAFPNPFNSSTKIKYTIPVSADVRLDLYDVLGRKIKNVIGEFQDANIYEIDLLFNSESSGIYFYRLKVGENWQQTKKILLLR